jgi:hypothetical protein
MPAALGVAGLACTCNGGAGVGVGNLEACTCTRHMARALIPNTAAINRCNEEGEGALTPGDSGGGRGVPIRDVRCPPPRSSEGRGGGCTTGGPLVFAQRSRQHQQQHSTHDDPTSFRLACSEQ